MLTVSNMSLLPLFITTLLKNDLSSGEEIIF
jgi:hypothetical protein